jgi:hypothetical protein
MPKKNNTVKITTPTCEVTLKKTAGISLGIYAEEFARACKRLKIDPRVALVETDDFPKLMRGEQVEFMVGYIHGCAEAHEVTPLALWDAIFPPAPDRFEKLAKAVDGLKQNWFGKKARA